MSRLTRTILGAFAVAAFILGGSAAVTAAPPANAEVRGSCNLNAAVVRLDATGYRFGDSNVATFRVDGNPEGDVFFGRALHFSSGALDPNIDHVGIYTVTVNGVQTFGGTVTVPACA